MLDIYMEQIWYFRYYIMIFSNPVCNQAVLFGTKVSDTLQLVSYLVRFNVALNSDHLRDSINCTGIDNN